MVIFHSYVSLPEGNSNGIWMEYWWVASSVIKSGWRIPEPNERRRIIEVNGWLPCLITSRFTDVPSVNSIMENHNFQSWGSYHWTKLMASSSQLVTVFQGNFRNSTTAGINSCRPVFPTLPPQKPATPGLFSDAATVLQKTVHGVVDIQFHSLFHWNFLNQGTQNQDCVGSNWETK